VTGPMRRGVLRAALLALCVGALGVVAGGDLLHGLVGAATALAGGVWLMRRRRVRRQQEHGRALAARLPDAVDLLASTVDGGAAPEIALARVADFVEEPLRTALLDAIAHGSEGGVGARLCVLDPALRPLGSLLLQSEELGVPIAAALRLLAADARARARAAAGERAAAAAPKMLLVVGGLLAPASLLVVIGGQVLVLQDLAGTVLV